jgi:hypothetical protein
MALLGLGLNSKHQKAPALNPSLDPALNSSLGPAQNPAEKRFDTVCNQSDTATSFARVNDFFHL